MNSMQRVLTTLSHKEPDRVPLFLLTALQGAKQLGLSIEDYYSRADYVIEGQMRLLKKYRSDYLYPFFYVPLELEAWGGGVIFQPDCPPNTGAPIIYRPEEIDHLQPPRVSESPCLTRVLDTIRQLKARVGDTMPIIAVATSPFSLPVIQMGFDRYTELIYEQPERLARLMQINEEGTAGYRRCGRTLRALSFELDRIITKTSFMPSKLRFRQTLRVRPSRF